MKQINCYKCKKEAVYNLRTLGKYICKSHFLELTEKRMHKTLHKNRLVKRGDKIAIALSGGKDSVTILHLLSKMKERWNLSLIALMVDEGIKGYSKERIKLSKEVAEELKIPYRIIEVKKEMKQDVDSIARRKSPQKTCTFCGVFRRMLLNKAAREEGASKIATGHNLDDEVQSFMMNVIRGEWSRVARSGSDKYKIKKEKMIPRIKPLQEITEKEVAIYAMLKKYKFYEGSCPYSQESMRTDIRECINKLNWKYPEVKNSLRQSFKKVLPLISKSKTIQKGIYTCEECGEISSQKVCKSCILLKRLLNHSE